MENDQFDCQISEENFIKPLITSWNAQSLNEEEILNLLVKTKQSVLNIAWLNRPLLRFHLARAMLNSLRSYASSQPSINLSSALIESSITDPWYQTPLAMILYENGDAHLNHYCANTECDVLLKQLGGLSRAKSIDFALKLCVSCLTVPRLKTNVQIKEMYCTLLFQSGMIDRLTQEMLSAYSCETGIDFVVRLLTSASAEVALSFAACVIQIFLVHDLSTKTILSRTTCLLQMWVSVQHRLGVDLHSLRAKVTMLSGIFNKSAHCYRLLHSLVTSFGSGLSCIVCIELYVKGLTMDLNSLEMARMEARGVREIEVHLADVLVCLAWVFGEESLLARECYLSAFSIDPTEDRMKRVRELKGFAGSCHCILKGSCEKFVGFDREVEAELDGLPEELLGDLAIVLNKPRNKMLSWELEWSELEKLCGFYLAARTAQSERKKD